MGTPTEASNFRSETGHRLLEAGVEVDDLAIVSHKVLDAGVDQVGTRAATNVVRGTRQVRRVDEVVARAAVD